VRLEVKLNFELIDGWFWSGRRAERATTRQFKLPWTNYVKWQMLNCSRHKTRRPCRRNIPAPKLPLNSQTQTSQHDSKKKRKMPQFDPKNAAPSKNAPITKHQSPNSSKSNNLRNLLRKLLLRNLNHKRRIHSLPSVPNPKTRRFVP
jgi:hypothetical protein